MSASALSAGSRSLQVLHQILACVVDQPRGGVAELTELLERGRKVRPLLDQHVQCGRDVLERTVDHVTLAGELAGDSIELLDGRDDVVPLRIEHADEVVEPGEQLTDLGSTPVQRDAEVVDDVADLTEPARVDDRRERRQRLLGGRDRSTTGSSASVAPGCRRPLGFSPIGGSSAKCIDPSRLVCPTVATALAGTATSGLTEISTSACQSSTVILPTLPTTTSLIITGELDSSVATFGTWTW